MKTCPDVTPIRYFLKCHCQIQSYLFHFCFMSQDFDFFMRTNGLKFMAFEHFYEFSPNYSRKSLFSSLVGRNIIRKSGKRIGRVVNLMILVYLLARIYKTNEANYRRHNTNSRRY